MSRLQLPLGYRSIEALEKQLHEISEDDHIAKGQRRALSLFRSMAQRVPAYIDFLKKNKIDPSKVNSVKDLEAIPPVDKDNYLRVYPREMLCWDGAFSKGSWVVSTTSGSTGKPYYFPRQTSQDWQYAVSAELYLRNNFEIHKKSTLYIVCFPMGAWIGGVFTYEAVKLVSQHGKYDLSIITPGIDKKEVINAVKQLGSSFDQIIIGAYAPFLKDILDDGAAQGVKWADYDLGFVFSAEAFSEKFRDYVSSVTKPSKLLKFSLNHYGTVDLGTMAHETPESILIRRTLIDQSLLGSVFPEKDKQPTLCQYDPALFYFEAHKENLLCSAFSGIPLFRYDLKDYGGVMKRSEIHKKLISSGVDINKLLTNADTSSDTWQLPFVYVYERKGFSVSYYAFLIYPDTIRRATLNNQFQEQITGKFSMKVDYDQEGRQKLQINIELRPKMKNSAFKNLKSDLENQTHQALLTESSEYRETFNIVGEVVKPEIKLWDYEDPTYFQPGGKQKWVI